MSGEVNDSFSLYWIYIYEYIEDLHNSMNKYFPNDQYIIMHEEVKYSKFKRD